MESTLHYFYNIVVNLSMLNYVRTLTLKKKKNYLRTLNIIIIRIACTIRLLKSNPFNFSPRLMLPHACPQGL
jgi:hypothetical protein